MADFPPCDDVCGALEEHVRRNFPDREVEAFTWTAGPLLEINPHFRALRISPGAGDRLTHYISVGGWAFETDDSPGIEFVLSVEEPTDRAVELLAMSVYYNRSGVLGLGHTLPIGAPWLPGSKSDHLLISLPYLWGPDLQISHVGDRHVEFLWLLPITSAERKYKMKRGLDALESRFEKRQIRFWDPRRKSLA